MCAELVPGQMFDTCVDMDVDNRCVVRLVAMTNRYPVDPAVTISSLKFSAKRARHNSAEVNLQKEDGRRLFCYLSSTIFSDKIIEKACMNI